MDLGNINFDTKYIYYIFRLLNYSLGIPGFATSKPKICSIFVFSEQSIQSMQCSHGSLPTMYIQPCTCTCLIFTGHNTVDSH